MACRFAVIRCLHRLRGEWVLSVEARYLEPELPDELGAEYRRTFDRLRGHFRVRGICAEEAADMAQEAAIRAFVHVRRRGVTGDNLVPLMNQIARNMLIDRHRRGGPQMVALDDAADSAADDAVDPTEAVVSLEARRAVRDAVDSLPDRHREAILYALAGMNPAEVAERMGIGRNAADALLHRARRSLKDRLRAVGEGAFGLVAIAGFRIREAARRAGIRPGVADVSAVGAFQGGVGAAAAAIVVALNFGAPVTASAHGMSFASKSVAASAPAASVGDSRSAVVQASGAGNGTGGFQTVSVGLARASTDGNIGSSNTRNSAGVAKPDDPDSEIFGIDYSVYDNGEENGGAIGEQEDALCTTSPEGCEAIRKGLGG